MVIKLDSLQVDGLDCKSSIARRTTQTINAFNGTSKNLSAHLQVMRSTLDTSADLVLFRKLDGGLYMFDRLDLGNVNWDQALITGLSRVAVDSTIAVTALPGC
jgi:hypothetical protein